MITVTNGLEKITIDKKYLKKTKQGFLIVPINDYWMINLYIIMDKNNISKIIKVLPFVDENLESFINLEKSSNLVRLTEKDFLCFKKLYENMQKKTNLKKDIYVEAIAKILAFEYYQANILEDYSLSMEEIFDNEFSDFNNYKKYRLDILAKAQEYFKSF